jgi:hypothetical protein
VRRECFASASGLRDAMWSLRRALREARELIYVESAQFARTARPTGQPTAEQVDLVGEIVTSLTAHPNLRVIICTPRDSDFAANYPGWGREHYKARTEAVSNLLAAAPDRIVAFHPVGFPGHRVHPHDQHHRRRRLVSCGRNAFPPARHDVRRLGRHRVFRPSDG